METIQENYLEIMIQSLQKKAEVLDKIIAQNNRQTDALKDPQLSVDDFEAAVKEKEALIEQLDLLDSGFDRLFGKVRDSLKKDRVQYRDEIKLMQDLIRRITEKSNEISTQEIRNKDLAVQKFSNIRKQIKEVRTGHKIASQYYKNMMNLNYVDSQFLDRKK